MTAALAAEIVSQCAVAFEVSLEGKRLTLGFIAAMVLVVLGGVTASGIQFGDLQFV